MSLDLFCPVENCYYSGNPERDVCAQHDWVVCPHHRVLLQARCYQCGGDTLHDRRLVEAGFCENKIKGVAQKCNEVIRGVPGFWVSLWCLSGMLIPFAVIAYLTLSGLLFGVRLLEDPFFADIFGACFVGLPANELLGLTLLQLIRGQRQREILAVVENIELLQKYFEVFPKNELRLVNDDLHYLISLLKKK